MPENAQLTNSPDKLNLYKKIDCRFVMMHTELLAVVKMKLVLQS